MRSKGKEFMSQTQILPYRNGEQGWEPIPRLPPCRKSISIAVRDVLGIRLTWTEYRITSYSIAKCESIHRGLSFVYRLPSPASVLTLVLLLFCAAVLSGLAISAFLTRGSPPESVSVSIPLGPLQREPSVTLTPYPTVLNAPDTNDAAAPKVSYHSVKRLNLKLASRTITAGQAHDGPSPASADLASRNPVDAGASVARAPTLLGAIPPSVRGSLAPAAAPIVPRSFAAAVRKALATQEVVSWQANDRIGYVLAGPAEAHGGVRCHTITSWQSGGAQGEAQMSRKCVKARS